MRSFRRRLSILLAAGMIVQSAGSAMAASLQSAEKDAGYRVESQKEDSKAAGKASGSNADDKEDEIRVTVATPLNARSEAGETVALEFQQPEIRGIPGDIIYLQKLLKDSYNAGNVSFTSSNPDVVKVDSTVGFLKGLGDATITAVRESDETGEAQKAQLTVHVVERQLKFTEEAPIRIRVGEEKAIPVDRTWLGLSYNNSIKYESSNDSVLVNRYDHSIVGKKAGKATLTITADGDGGSVPTLTGTLEVEVYTDVKLGDVKVEKAFPDATVISWTMENTAQYRVERSEDGGPFRTLVRGTDGKEQNRYVDSGLKKGSTYIYRVTACTADGEPPMDVESKEVQVTVETDKKVTIKAVRRIYVNETHQLELEYTGYGEEKAAVASWTVKDPEVIKIDNSGKITGLKEGETQITVVLTDGNEYTCETAVLKGNEAKELKVTANYGQYIKLAWEMAENTRRYVVYRQENNGAWEKLGEETKTEFVDKTAQRGHTYKYKVAAVHTNIYTKNEYETEGVTVDVTVSNLLAYLQSETEVVRKGKTYDLPLKLEGFDTPPQLKCESSDEKVATVDSETGKVTIKGEGQAQITIQLPDGPTLVCTYFCAERPSGIYTDNEWKVFTLTNQNRMEEDHDPLSMFGQMQEATDIRKKELTRLYSHTRPDGSDCFTAFDEVGIEVSGAGENIASGQRSPEEVVRAWMNSPGHYANIMGNYTHFATGNTGTSWVQMFLACNDPVELISMAPPKGSRKFKQGTEIEDFGEIVVVNCKSHGNAFMPLLSQMCTGYDKDEVGEQTITVHYKDLTTQFKVTVEKKTSSSGGGGGSSSGGGGGGSSSGGGGGGSSSGGGGGSSSGTKGGSGGGPAGGASQSGSLPSYVVSGSWTQANGAWRFTDASGQPYVNRWAAVSNPYANTAAGQSAFDWFFFDGAGNMLTGWYRDTDGSYYYLNPNSDGTLGRMLTGWTWISGADGVSRCYYLNPNSDGTRGKMMTNTTVEGYVLNGEGQWTVNGVVKVR